MAQRRTLVTVTTPTISSLLRMIVSGQLALPRPRRPYTWTKSEGRDLLQAMWEGRDIGSLVIAQLHAADMTLDNLVKVTIFLSDRRYIPEYRQVRSEVMGERRPALTCIITGIFDTAWLLEIEAVACA